MTWSAHQALVPVRFTLNTKRVASKNWFCALYLTTELEGIVPIAGAGMVRLRGDQVAAGNQLVALDGGIVVDRPAILAEGLGEVEGQPVEIKN